MTLQKIKDSVIGDPKTNQTTDLTGKVFKIKVDHIGKSEESGIKGIVPVDTFKDEKGENIFSIIPENQGTEYHYRPCDCVCNRDGQMIKLRPVISKGIETGQKQYFESLREVESFTYIDKEGVRRPFRP